MTRGETASATLPVLALRLGGEEFGLDVHEVHEVVRPRGVQPLVGAPGFVEGALELRGAAVPVIDLRRRFGLVPDQDRREARLVIARLGAVRVGLLVDAVTEVLAMPEEALAAPPAFFRGRASESIRAIARLDERLIILLELDRILTSEEREALAQAERWLPDASSG